MGSSEYSLGIGCSIKKTEDNDYNLDIFFYTKKIEQSKKYIPPNIEPPESIISLMKRILEL